MPPAAILIILWRSEYLIITLKREEWKKAEVDFFRDIKRE